MQENWRRPHEPTAFDHRRVLRRGRARRRRRPWLFLIVGASLLLSFWILDPGLNGWTHQPVEARAQAIQALEEAREMDAARWAPDSLKLAEDALRSGMGAERHEAAQIFFLRDFRPVENQYLAAVEMARRAAISSLLIMDDARYGAGTELERARRMLASAEDVAQELPFPRRERMLLQHARTLVDEGQILYLGQEYADARQRAQRAAEEAEDACRGVLPLAQRFVDGSQVDLWRRWIRETIDWSREHGRTAVIVYKEKNLVQLYRNGKPIRTYSADMGRNCLYPKSHAGDGATPEGRYRIVSKKDRGNSSYYKALLLDYPNSEDRERFRQRQRRGEISSYARLGGMIEIHGEGGRGQDWTLGCVALSNADMSDLFAKADVGTPVTIVGGDGRDGTFSNLARSLLRRDLGSRD